MRKLVRLIIILSLAVVPLFAAVLFHHAVVSAAQAGICGHLTAPPERYDHVIWILEENRGLNDVIGSPAAPFVTGLARQCAYTINFTDNEPRQNLGAGYHSLSHYLADTSGSNCAQGNGRQGKGCVYNDNLLPMRYTLSTMSIFQQIEEAGGSWKSYQESSPGSCSMVNSGKYTFRHDAAVYYTPIRQSCLTHDVPVPPLASLPKGALIDDITNDRLPTFAYITPDLEHDMHDGTVAEGDAWLKAYLEPLLRSRTWQAGRTVVFVIWDEASRSDQTLPNAVIAPTASGGAANIVVNGFAVLRATEQMLGLPYLGCAAGKPPGGVGQCYSGATADLQKAFRL